MALETLTARANTGTGTDALAVVPTALGKAGAVALVSGDGVLVDAANRVPVAVDALPLPTGAATEGTLVQVRDRLLVASNLNPLDSTPGQVVRQAPQKYTDISFSQVGAGLQSPEMVQIGPTGTGMAISQSAGNLVITSGTTANAELTIRSVATFNGALTMKEVTTLSQRIVNNNFFVELVDVIGDGLAYTIVNATTVDVTLTAHGYTAINVGQRMDICAITGAAGIPMEAVIASIPNANTIRFTVAGWPATGTGTCSLTGWNKIELNYTGTVATAVNFNTRRRGWQNTAVAATINTTAAAQMGIVNVENGVASLADKVVTSAGVIANRASWDTNIPRTNETLFLQIRARNGTVAPASTTTWTVGMLRVEDYVPTQVSLVSTRVQSAQSSAPVSVIGTVPVSLATNAPVLAAGANLAADVGVQIRATTNGTSFTNILSAATNNLTQLKATQGKIAGGFLTNTTASLQYVKLFSVPSASVTMGTTAAATQIALQPNQTVNLSQGPLGIFLGGTGLTIAITTGSALTDNTATTAGSVVGFISWV
jgi:hypothetical protein